MIKNNNTPSFTTTTLQAFDKVKNGEWTAEQFTQWVEMRTRDAYNHGTDAGYVKGFSDGDSK